MKLLTQLLVLAALAMASDPMHHHSAPIPQAQVCAVLFDAALVAEVEAITDPEMWPIFYALADDYNAVCGGSR